MVRDSQGFQFKSAQVIREKIVYLIANIANSLWALKVKLGSLLFIHHQQ